MKYSSEIDTLTQPHGAPNSYQWGWMYRWILVLLGVMLGGFNQTDSYAVDSLKQQNPAWVPAIGAIADVSLNTMYDVRGTDKKTGGHYYDWSGAAWAEGYGRMGTLIFHGGGHSDSAENSVYGYDVATRLHFKERRAAPIFYHSDKYCADTVTGWMWASTSGVDVQVGEPFAFHSYNRLTWLPPEAISGYAPNGWLYSPGRGSMALVGQVGTLTHHKLALGLAIDTPWTMHGQGIANPAHTWAIYDSSRNRMVWAYGDAPYTMRYLYYMDLATQKPGQIKWGASDGPGITPYYAYGKYDELEDLYYNIRFTVAGGQGVPAGLWFTVIDPKALKSYAPETSGALPGFIGEAGVEWVEKWRAFVFFHWASNTVWTLKAPSNPRTGTWKWDSQTLTGTIRQPRVPNPIYTKFRYVPAIDAFLWPAAHDVPMQVFRINPP